MPFGQPALAAQLQRRAARAGVPEELARLDPLPAAEAPEIGRAHGTDLVLTVGSHGVGRSAAFASDCAPH